MEKQRCDNCDAPTINFNIDSLFKRCEYCEKPFERVNINITSDIFTIEDIYYNEIISGHRLFVGTNLKNDYDFIKLSNNEIDNRIDKLVIKLFEHYKTLTNHKEKYELIKAINNIYNVVYQDN